VFGFGYEMQVLSLAPGAVAPVDAPHYVADERRRESVTP
jgi:hypothetical protein